ncbi:MAG: anti-sigma factor antagonist [Oscillospiraceae bacterium]|nr:anti-sigma factor antagonist [Oscillospiraceae bacterium]
MELERMGDTLTIKIIGDLDHHVTNEIRSKIDENIDSQPPAKLIFDLSRVGFMDSSGIGIIMGRYKKVTAYGGTVAFSGIHTCIDKLVQMSGLLRIIPEIKEAI